MAIKKTTALILSLALTLVIYGVPQKIYAATDIVNDATLSTQLIECWDDANLKGASTSPLTLTKKASAGAITSTSSDPGNTASSSWWIDNDPTSNVQYLERADDGTFDFGSGAFSLSIWVYILSTVSQSEMSITSKFLGGDDQRSWKLRWDVNNNLLKWQVTNAGNGGGLTVDKTAVDANDTWYHIVITQDASQEVTMWLDGSGTVEGTVQAAADSAAPFIIGTTDNGGQGQLWNGYIYQAAYWNTKLSSSSVTSLYNSGSGIPSDLAVAGGGDSLRS